MGLGQAQKARCGFKLHLPVPPSARDTGHQWDKLQSCQRPPVHRPRRGPTHGPSPRGRTPRTAGRRPRAPPLPGSGAPPAAGGRTAPRWGVGRGRPPSPTHWACHTSLPYLLPTCSSMWRMADNLQAGNNEVAPGGPIMHPAECPWEPSNQLNFFFADAPRGMKCTCPKQWHIMWCESGICSIANQ